MAPPLTLGQWLEESLAQERVRVAAQMARQWWFLPAPLRVGIGRKLLGAAYGLLGPSEAYRGLAELRGKGLSQFPAPQDGFPDPSESPDLPDVRELGPNYVRLGPLSKAAEHS